MQPVARVVVGSIRLVLLVGLFAQSLVQPVAAQQVPGSGTWAPAAGAQGDNTYAGFIDQPSAGASITAGTPFHVSGWVVDTTAQGWAGIDGVQVLLGSTVLANGSVALSRPDVASVTGNPAWAAAGFDVVVSSVLPAGAQTLTVVVHTPDKGSWSRSLSVNVGGAGGAAASAATSATSASSGGPLVLTIIAPHSDDRILANNNGAIYGVAYDTRTRAELGVGVDRVQLYLDAPRGQAGSQNLGDATLNGDQWSLTWAPTKYDRVAHHVLYVYAHSSVTGEEVLLTEEINIVES